MTCSTLRGLGLFTFAAAVGFLAVRAAVPHEVAELPKPKASESLPSVPPDLSFLNLPEVKLPKARTVPDLVTELDGEDAANTGVRLTSWQLGYPRTMRLMEAMLAEKRSRNGNDAAAAIAWLAQRLIAGKDTPALEALAGEPAGLAEAARVLDLLHDPGQAIAFAKDVLSQQCALEPRLAMDWLAEMKRRQLGTTEPYAARDFLPARDAYDDLLERWKNEGARDVLARIGRLRLPEADSLVFTDQWLYGPAGEDAAELAENIRQPGPTPPIVESAMEALIRLDPVLAAETVVEVDLPPEKQAGLENEILSAWVEKDALAALPWFYEHRTKLKQEEAVQNVVARWLTRSPWSLQTYIGKAPQGKETDELIQAVLAKLEQQDRSDKAGPADPTALKRAAVETMIARLSDPALREQAKQNLPTYLAK